jgi:hypothetical protein
MEGLRFVLLISHERKSRNIWSTVAACSWHDWHRSHNMAVLLLLLLLLLSASWSTASGTS